MPSSSRDILLSIDEYSISETDFGGVERWYLEITSKDIVNTDIKSVIDYLFKRSFLSLKTIKLL